MALFSGTASSVVYQGNTYTFNSGGPEPLGFTAAGFVATLQVTFAGLNTMSGGMLASLVLTDGSTATYTGGSGTSVWSFTFTEAYAVQTLATVAVGNILLGANTTVVGNGATSTGTVSLTTAAKKLPISTCLVAGTRVATSRGEVAVETLVAGDQIVLAGGGTRPVKWLGHTFYEAGMLTAYADLRPVLIRAGALGGGLPVRDLRVSSMHGIAIDGVLVPAAALINGASIVRDAADGDVTYYHVELDAHDIMLTEGAPTESFIDNENSRVFFDNAAEYYDLFGADDAEAVPCMSMVREGYQLEAIRNRLAQAAGQAGFGRSVSGALRSNVEAIQNGTVMGWVMDAQDHTRTVEVEVLAHGEVIGRTLANRYRRDLYAAGLGDGAHAFSMAVPPSVTSLADVQVRRAADGAMLGMQAFATAN